MVAPDALIRALELARALNQPEQIEEIGGLMIELAGSSMEDEAWAPGVPLVLLTALGQLPAEARPGELGELLERAKARFCSDPYTVQSVIELQAALNRDDPERERELHAQMVDRFREAGAKHPASSASHTSSTRSNSRENTVYGTNWRLCAASFRRSARRIWI
jgi:hypothetical protein